MRAALSILKTALMVAALAAAVWILNPNRS